MSHEATAWAKAQKIKSSPQKLLYMLLADRISNESGECFPGQELLAEEATMSISQVKLHLKALETAKYLTRRKRFRPDGRPTSDCYSFPGFMEWLKDSRQNARDLHDIHAKKQPQAPVLPAQKHQVRKSDGYRSGNPTVHTVGTRLLTFIRNPQKNQQKKKLY